MNKKKMRKEEIRESRKESKKKQELVLHDLAQLLESTNKTVDIEGEDIDEIEAFSGFVEEESSVAGRVLADLIYTFTNDFEIGKLIKSGEIRKKVVGV